MGGSPARSWRFRVPDPRGPVEPGAAPSFSVVIATYQAARTVAAAVQSVLDQTRPPLELIVVDDGSTDDTRRVLAPFAGRITLITQENRGAPAARNAAVRAASGEFFAILDADDAFLPQRLEALGTLGAARPDLDLLMTDAYMEVQGSAVGRFCAGTPFATEGQPLAIADRCFLVAPAVRRETFLGLGGFDESILNGEDWECWIRFLLAGSSAGLVDEPLYRYTMTVGSLSDNRVDSLRARVAVLEKAASMGSVEEDEREAIEQSLRRTRRQLMLTEAEAGLRLRSRDSRRLSISVAVGSDFPVRTRIKALAAAVAPRVARRRLEAREAQEGVSRIRRSVPQ